MASATSSSKSKHNTSHQNGSLNVSSYSSSSSTIASGNSAKKTNSNAHKSSMNPVYDAHQHQNPSLHQYHLNNNNSHHNGHGNATTTSSSGSSSGYDTSSLSTVTAPALVLTTCSSPHDYSSSNSCSSSSGGGVVGGGTLSKSSSPTVNTLSSVSSSKMTMMMSLMSGDAASSSSTDEMYAGLGGDELNNLMNAQLSLMDLPPDKLKIVKQLPDEKKIQFLRSLRFLGNGKNPPEYYVQALATYTDVIVNTSGAKRAKFQVAETSTELIKALEVSLRTNRIDWVHKFLDPPLNGLDMLIEYLKSSLTIMRENDKYNNLLDATTDMHGIQQQRFLNGNGASSNASTLQFSGANGTNINGHGNGMNGTSHCKILLH